MTPAGGSDEGDRAGWPVQVEGVVESVVTTRGPDGRWAVAALGLRGGDPVTARTWGRTRTRRNFDREGDGVVQFTRDPVAFVEAALAAATADEPVLDAADAWVPVSVERLDAGVEAGVEWVDWALHPGAATVRREGVATVARGFNAVVEATVAASRLGVPGYDDAELRRRLVRLHGLVERCGTARDREAMARLDALVDG